MQGMVLTRQGISIGSLLSGWHWGDKSGSPIFQQLLVGGKRQGSPAYPECQQTGIKVHCEGRKEVKSHHESKVCDHFSQGGYTIWFMLRRYIMYGILHFVHYQILCLKQCLLHERYMHIFVKWMIWVNFRAMNYGPPGKYRHLLDDFRKPFLVLWNLQGTETTTVTGSKLLSG